jgi:hypothetical protein
VPAGTSLGSTQAYDQWCISNGLSPNKNKASQYQNDGAGMYSSSAYYCNGWCCYLGSGNSQWNNASQIENFGLPTGKKLRVFDRGCGFYNGNYAKGLNTTDAITVNGPSSITFHTNNYGSYDYNSSSNTTMQVDGVIVCQEP